jgi:hypothetical protein
MFNVEVFTIDFIIISGFGLLMGSTIVTLAYQQQQERDRKK